MLFSNVTTLQKQKFFILVCVMVIFILFYIDVRTSHVVRVNWIVPEERRYVDTIPDTIYVCYKNQKDIPLRSIERWQELNPDYNIRIYGDIECRETLKEIGDWAVKLFDRIPDGPIRADLWRAAILYLNGGIYVDIDSIPKTGLDYVLEEDTTFATAMSYVDGSTNPAFLASTKENPIMKSVLDMYRYRVSKEVYSYDGYSICPLVASVLDAYGIDMRNKRSRVEMVYGQIVTLLQEKSSLKHPYFWQSHTDFKLQMGIYYHVDVFVMNRGTGYDSEKHEFV